MDKVLIIPVEVKNRDFDARLLTAFEAVLSGFKVIIGNQATISRDIDCLPVGIYFDKSLSKNKLGYFEKIKSFGFELVSIDEEGLMVFNNSWTYLKQRVSRETGDISSAIFVWGDYEKKFIVDNYSELESKVVVTGNPRVELCRNYYATLYSSVVDNIRSLYGDYILFPSSFVVKHAAGDGYLDKVYEDYGIVENREDRELFKSENDYQKKVFDLYVKLVADVAAYFYDKNIIVRPHPSEDESYWKTTFKDVDNVKITKNGNVAAWILGSACVVHSSCTTGLESYLIGKPTISYLPFDDHGYTDHISNLVSVKCTRGEHVIQELRAIIGSGDKGGVDSLDADSQKKLNEVIADPCVVLSSKLIVEQLLEIYNKKINCGCANKIESVNIPLYRRLRNLLIDLRLKMNRKRWYYIRQKYPGSTVKEVFDFWGVYKEINSLSEDLDINVSEIDSELYCIESSIVA